jgi:hypothetical protein
VHLVSLTEVLPVTEVAAEVATEVLPVTEVAAFIIQILVQILTGKTIMQAVIVAYAAEVAAIHQQPLTLTTYFLTTT